MAIVDQTSLTFSYVLQAWEQIKERLDDCNISFESCCQHIISSGESAWTEPEEFRLGFSSLYHRHVTDISKRFLSFNAESIVLELGAGYITQKRSALTRHFPEAKFMYSDLSLRTFLAAREDDPHVPYLCLDSSRLTEKVESSSLDAVIASSFLDTLPRAKLFKTLEQVFAVLKERGMFVHLSDLEPFLNTLVIDHIKEPGIMFPLVDDELFVKGIQFVPREEVEAFCLNSKKIEARTLRSYLRGSSDTRAAIIVSICSSKIHLARTLSDWVMEHFPNHRREVINEDFFRKRVEDGLRRAKFEIVSMEPKILEALEPRSEFDSPESNCFSLLRGRLTERYIDLPCRVVKKALQIHVVVARKAVCNI